MLGGEDEKSDEWGKIRLFKVLPQVHSWRDRLSNNLSFDTKPFVASFALKINMLMNLSKTCGATFALEVQFSN